jgi:hypothetical protein
LNTLIVVPVESVVPPATVSHLSLGKASKDTEEVGDERVLERNKDEEARYVTKDGEHAAQTPVEVRRATGTTRRVNYHRDTEHRSYQDQLGDTTQSG